MKGGGREGRREVEERRKGGRGEGERGRGEVREKGRGREVQQMFYVLNILTF